MVAAARRDGVDPAVTGQPVTYTVDVPGGRLVITERPDGEVEMTGPAVIVAEGTIDPAGWPSARDGPTAAVHARPRHRSGSAVRNRSLERVIRDHSRRERDRRTWWAR